MKQRRDVGRAEDKVDLIESELAELEAELADELDELERKYDVSRTEFEPETIKPYKKDIDIKSVVLLWLPYDEQNKPFW